MSRHSTYIRYHGRNAHGELIEIRHEGKWLTIEFEGWLDCAVQLRELGVAPDDRTRIAACIQWGRLARRDSA